MIRDWVIRCRTLRMGLTIQETKKLTSLLERVTYPLPPELFYFIAGAFPMVAVETVAWRLPRSRGGIEVLLSRRPPLDPFWPNLWHVPGTIVRNHEEFTAGFRRIEHEIGAAFSGTPQFVRAINFSRTKRGHVISLVFTGQLKNAPSAGTFFPTRDLPRDFIPEQKEIIAAVAQFVRRRQKPPNRKKPLSRAIDGGIEICYLLFSGFGSFKIDSRRRTQWTIRM